MKKRILGIALCLVMVLSLLPSMAFAASYKAGDIADTTGAGTEYDPVVVDTFAEFKAAMENFDIGYVRLSGNQREVLPKIDKYASAIMVYGPGNVKHLSIEGDSSFIASRDSAAYDSLIHVSSGMTLYVSGMGSLTFYPNANNSYNAVIRNEGRCQIQDATLRIDLGLAVYGYAVANTGGNLSIYSGHFYGTTAFDTTGPFAAVRVDSGTVSISGGTFQSTIADGYTISAGTNALYVKEGASCTVTGGIFTSGIYTRNRNISAILGSGIVLTDESGNTIYTDRSRHNGYMEVTKAYDYYIDGVRVTEKNKRNVLGNSTVRFYAKGEFDRNCNVVELTGFEINENSGLGYYKYDKDKMAAMYFGEDTIVLLHGDNSILGDEAYDGIVTGEYCKLEINGKGMLYVDVGTENTAVFAPGGIVTVSERADVNLFGYEAMDLSYTDDNVVVKDNATLYCYTYQNNNGYDGTGLVGRGVEVYDNAAFIAECQYNGDAISTWVEPYSSNDYDIKILKKGEYQNAQFSWDKKAHQPHLLENGLNTSNGVSEGECRYISMKAKLSSFLKGDVNGDGVVTDADAVYLLYYTFFGDAGYPVNQPCDFNGDGAVTDADAVYLLYYTFFGEESYPLH